MLAIKRAGILLDRDIVFVATGDEEEGGKLGAGWFVEHEHNILINPVHDDMYHLKLAKVEPCKFDERLVR